MIHKLKKWISGNDSSVLNQKIDIIALQKIIKHEFQDQGLLIQAVSHRSVYVVSEKQIYSNERLEFLGDAVLELIVTEFLFSKFKDESEGSLSQKKAILVSQKVLSKVSRDLGLGEFLILNKGEEKTGGRSRPSNLANVFEAILGAIYMDSDIATARKFVNKFLIDKYKELLKTKTYFNYKSSLLELSQAKGWGAPKYSVLEETGPDHQKEFIVMVKAGQDWQAQGKGLNKKSAEQDAAMNLMNIIPGKNPN
jgi:ribonuclease-3